MDGNRGWLVLAIVSVCTPSASAQTCGNGIVEATEECDGDGLGMGGETAECDTDCTLAFCNDGTVNVTAGEECLNWSVSNDDGCTNTCYLTPGLSMLCAGSVSNDVLEEGEECDDGAHWLNQWCLPTCQLPFCGDGFRSPDEECDDAELNGGASCTSACTVPACNDRKDNDGDGQVDGRDPGCSDPSDDSEASPPCSGGINSIIPISRVDTTPVAMTMVLVFLLLRRRSPLTHGKPRPWARL